MLNSAPCRECASGKTLAQKSSCFIRYVFWLTDPLPVEILISWLSITWGIRYFLEENFYLFGSLNEGAFGTCWSSLFIIGGLFHGLFLCKPNRLILFFRQLGFILLSFLWTLAAGINIWELHHFIATPTVLAFAAAWVLLRNEVKS